MPQNEDCVVSYTSGFHPHLLFSLFVYLLYSCLAVRSGKKSPNEEIGLGNRGLLKLLNDTKLVLNEHGLPS